MKRVIFIILLLLLATLTAHANELPAPEPPPGTVPPLAPGELPVLHLPPPAASSPFTPLLYLPTVST